MSDLSHMRLLVVGGSSGIGRATGLVAAGRGARVAFAARSGDLLERTLETAGDGCVAIRCDVDREADCERVVAEAQRALGGLTALVYAAAVPAIEWFERLDGEAWRRALRINLVGAALVVRAALPHLRACGGRVVLLSSETAVRPRPGMVAYSVTKAALEQLADALRTEVPEVGFTRVAIGPTAETRLSSSLDRDFLRPFFAAWRERHYDDSRWMQPEEVGRAIVDVLAADVAVHETAVYPPGLLR